MAMVEVLEARTLLTTTIYIDFGDNFQNQPNGIQALDTTMGALTASNVKAPAIASSDLTFNNDNDIDTTVTVDNRSLVDMTIYATRGQRIRLGVANANSRTVLVIPPVLLGGAGLIRFVADPIGSNRTSVSEEISVSKGDDIGLLIPPG